MKKNIIIISSFFLLIVGLLCIYSCIPKIEIEINGLKNETIEVFSDYQDKGASAYRKTVFSKKELPIQIEGEVDTKKIGVYEISYIVTNHSTVKKATRQVHVEDKTPPTIEVTEDTIKACPNQSPLSVTVKAFDNYDGDITNQVVQTIENDILQIRVTDSSHNMAEKQIPIIYMDTEAPIITLKGDSTIYLLKGNHYQELGYEAHDNCEGDITKKVHIKNPVNSNEVGTYQIEYSVMDQNNNKTTIVRTVKVFDKNTTIVPEGRTIYLTFDDGPGYNTGAILEVLREYNVKATFFVTNQFPQYQYYIKQAYDEGHAIGLHTYSHIYRRVYESEDAYFSDLNQMQEIVKKMTGVETKLIRFPGGSSNTVSRFNPGIMTRLTQEVIARGYRYFDWNVASGDTNTTSSSQIASNVIKSLGNNSTYVVLQHDIKSQNVEAVRKIIEYGLANGYHFAPLSMTSPTVHHGVNN